MKQDHKKQEREIEAELKKIHKEWQESGEDYVGFLVGEIAKLRIRARKAERQQILSSLGYKTRFA